MFARRLACLVLLWLAGCHRDEATRTAPITRGGTTGEGAAAPATAPPRAIATH